MQRQNINPISVGAVILAGGLARRMEGRDKGLIELAGKPLVEWVIGRVKPQVDSLVLSANRNAEAYGKFGYRVCADVIDGHVGPLAGLLTGMQNLDEEAVFMCPCDSPFVPEDMVVRLALALTNSSADIAVADDGQRMQPVFCLARRSTEASLRAFLDAGDRKIDRWYAGENCTRVDFSGSSDAFKNINTEEERLAVEQSLPGARSRTPR